MTSYDLSPPSAGQLRPLPIDVVSVQSHVVYGRVGNNVAVPTLEAHGLTVAAIPTVVLSNTPHYPTIHGGPVPIEWFAGYLRDLSARCVPARLKAVVSGYLGGRAQAEELGNWIDRTLQEQPRLLVVVDPVLGDHDSGEYVSAGMAEAYHNYLLKRADGLTPNDFELQRLTGLTVTDVASAIVAASTLLVGRTQWVVVTSAAPAAWAAGETQVVVVTRDRHQVFRHPLVDTSPKGTGDLFSSALTARMLTGASVFEATAWACDRVIAALRLTRRAQYAELLLPPTVATNGTAFP